MKTAGVDRKCSPKKGIWGMCWIVCLMRTLDCTHVGDLNYFVYFEVENVGLKRDTLNVPKAAKTEKMTRRVNFFVLVNLCANRHMRRPDLPQIQSKMQWTQKIRHKKTQKSGVRIEVIHIYVLIQETVEIFFSLLCNSTYICNKWSEQVLLTSNFSALLSSITQRERLDWLFVPLHSLLISSSSIECT